MLNVICKAAARFKELNAFEASTKMTASTKMKE